MSKREALEKKYYKAIKSGNYEQASRIMEKIVAMDVANLREKTGR